MSNIPLRMSLPALAAFCLISAPDRAVGQVEVVDQGYVDGGFTVYSIRDPHSLAQTFTVGSTGKLTRVDLGVWYYPLIDPTQILTVAIFPTSDMGVPLRDQPLASFTLTPADVSPVRGTLTRIDLGPMAFPVQQGDVLAVSASSIGGMGRGYAWSAHEDISPGSPYQRGGAFSRGLSGSPNDFAPRAADAHFITYVTVPEPSGLLIMTLATWLIDSRRRRSTPTA